MGATALQTTQVYAAEQWGTLTGRFVYSGDPPKRKPILITKDKEYCGKCNLLEEDLVVDAKTKGVAYIVVWLYSGRRDPAPTVHPSYAETEKADVVLDSTKCSIAPHVSLLRTTQTLLMRNTDPIGDGIKIDSFRNTPINLMFAPNSEVRRKFPKPERLPVHVSCPVHPWESGWLMVLPHPYMAASKPEGQFEIKNIPVGKWTFQFWHEKSGYLDKVTVAGKPEAWRRGRVDIEIHAGANDLGPIELAPTLFQK